MKYNLEMRCSRCVLNHNVQNECEKTVINNYIWYIIATDGGQLATTTCFGHRGGRRQVVHTKVDKLIQYANTDGLMSRFRTP